MYAESDPSLTAHLSAEVHAALARGQARRGKWELAIHNWQEAARSYADCGCPVLAALADAETDACRAELRPSYPVNISALID